MTSAEEIRHGEISALIALISMMKIKYMDSPEIYKTVLAFLSDYDPSQPSNRDRTLKYIRLLVTDEALANCLVMSLPDMADTTPSQGFPSCFKPYCDVLKHRDPSKVSSMVKTRPCLNPLQPSAAQAKATFSPIQTAAKDVSLGDDKKLELKTGVAETVTTDQNGTTKTTGAPVKMTSPAIITCDKGPSATQIKQYQTAALMAARQAHGPLPLIQRHTTPGTSKHPAMGAWPQSQGVRGGQGQFPTTSGRGQVFTPPVGMMVPFQYPDYRFQFPYQPIPGIQPSAGINSMFPWQYTNLMQHWAQNAAVQGSVDMCQQGQAGSADTCQHCPEQPVDLTGKVTGKQPAVQTHTKSHHKLKRSVSTTSTTAGDKDRSTPKPKLQKMNSDSALFKPVQGNKEFKTEASTPQRLGSASVQSKSPIGCLQDLVSAIEASENLSLKEYAKDEKIGSMRTTDLKKSKSLSSNQSLEQINTTSISGKASPFTASPVNVVSKQDAASSIPDNATRAFPYSQKICLPNGKYSVVNLNGENKVTTTTSQGPITHALSSRQLTPNTGLLSPTPVCRRSCSLSDLLKLPHGANLSRSESEQQLTEGLGEFGSVITETTRTQNSTTLKIKLNTGSSEKLLNQILKLQQAKGFTSVQSAPSTPDKNNRSGSTVPGSAEDGKTVTTQAFKKMSVLNTTGATSQVTSMGQSQVSTAAIQMVNSGTQALGQAFAIQTKPDFTANRIAVTDKVFLQTIKQRLQSKQQRSNSDSVLVTARKPKVLAQTSAHLGIAGPQFAQTSHSGIAGSQFAQTSHSGIAGPQFAQTSAHSGIAGPQFAQTSHLGIAGSQFAQTSAHLGIAGAQFAQTSAHLGIAGPQFAQTSHSGITGSQFAQTSAHLGIAGAQFAQTSAHLGIAGPQFAQTSAHLGIAGSQFNYQVSPLCQAGTGVSAQQRPMTVADLVLSRRRSSACSQGSPEVEDSDNDNEDDEVFE